MHHHYGDITSRIPEPPKWFDEEAVPRYCEFSPEEVANIYAREVVLAEIACQACGQRFPVAFSQAYPFDFHTGKPAPSLADRVKDGTLHSGDPPNVGCCASGPTMNSEPLAVVEFWRQEKFDWRRVPELEVPLRAPWASAPSPETSDAS